MRKDFLLFPQFDSLAYYFYNSIMDEMEELDNLFTDGSELIIPEVMPTNPDMNAYKPGKDGKLPKIPGGHTLRYNGDEISPIMRAAVAGAHSAGNSVRSISSQTGLCINVIRAIIRNDNIDPALVDTIKNGMSGKQWLIADSHADNANNTEGCTSYQSAGIMTYAIQNARLMEGQATQIIDSRTLTMSISELDRKIAEKEAQFRRAQEAEAK